MHCKRDLPMKLVLVMEDDRSVCEQTFNPEHYDYFHHNKEGILTMIKEQVSYITLLSYFLIKETLL
jgi:hypothetical protein